MRKLFILILLPALLGSCNAISSLVHDDQVVAKVGKNKLYKSELERFIPNMILPRTAYAWPSSTSTPGRWTCSISTWRRRNSPRASST